MGNEATRDTTINCQSLQKNQRLFFSSIIITIKQFLRVGKDVELQFNGSLSLALETSPAGITVYFSTGVPVQGTVTLDGQPLANKSVYFSPESGSGVGGGANTDANGKYELLAFVTGATGESKGVPPGRYKVIVTEPAIPIEMKGGDEQMEEMFMPDTVTKSTIPREYQFQDSTTLVFEVPAGGGTIDLELKSK